MFAVAAVNSILGNLFDQNKQSKLIKQCSRLLSDTLLSIKVLFRQFCKVDACSGVTVYASTSDFIKIEVEKMMELLISLMFRTKQDIPKCICAVVELCKISGYFKSKKICSVVPLGFVVYRQISIWKTGNSPFGPKYEKLLMAMCVSM